MNIKTEGETKGVRYILARASNDDRVRGALRDIHTYSAQRDVVLAEQSAQTLDTMIFGPAEYTRDDVYAAAARYVQESPVRNHNRLYRAYDTTTEWMGEARPTIDAADRDAKRHNDGCAKQGGYGSAIVVTQSDPSDTWPTCVDLEGKTVWPPHGRTSGAVRWPTKSRRRWSTNDEAHSSRYVRGVQRTQQRGARQLLE